MGCIREIWLYVRPHFLAEFQIYDPCTLRFYMCSKRYDYKIFCDLWKDLPPDPASPYTSVLFISFTFAEDFD